MDFICLDLREEEQWEAPPSVLRRMRKGLSSLEHLIKESCLFVIGQLEALIKLAAKMIQSLNIGINKETLDLLLHLI